MSDYRQMQKNEEQELWIELEWNETLKLNKQIDEAKNDIL